MRIYREFLFEAAHRLPFAPEGHANARIHGHSFRVRIWVEGVPDPQKGVVVHFDDLSSALKNAQDSLDHQYLNDVDGLPVPTLENIAIFLWDRLLPQIPGLAQIEIHRDSCREGCIYIGPDKTHIRRLT